MLGFDVGAVGPTDKDGSIVGVSLGSTEINEGSDEGITLGYMETVGSKVDSALGSKEVDGFQV